MPVLLGQMASESMITFIREVDPVANEPLVLKVAQLLTKVDIFEPCGLFGLTADYVSHSLSKLEEPVNCQLAPAW